MARLAFRLGVLSGEGKAGHRVVIEIDCLPGRDLMAPCTVLAVTALVDVIGGMAAKASGGGLCHLGRLLVASLAAGSAVRALEWEACHPVMIEVDLAPPTRGVTAGTVSPIGTLVAIVAGMTGIAAARWVLVGVTGTVAPRTGCRSVTADQRKTCGRMIESGSAPARSGMA